MQIHHVQNESRRKGADIAVIPFWIDRNQVEMACAAKEYMASASIAIECKDFLAKADESCVVYATNLKEPRILLLGLGKKEEVTVESIRRCYGNAVRLLRRKRWGGVSFFLPALKESYLVGMIEGALMANYAYDVLKRESVKQDPTFLIQEIQCIGSSKTFVALCKQKIVLMHSVSFARDLVNGNADEVTAVRLAALAKELKGPSLKVKVLQQKELEKQKMGLLLAVNKGSSQEPALIVMEYIGDPGSKEVTAVVGKGITFDTGGLNLKVSASIETMKCDMAGAAAVLGVLKAAKELSLKKNIIGVIASAENAIGPNSYKPGDVVISHSGKSVEINDTDAEGRLVLADALSYLQTHYKPSRIIDLATLTGGVVIALGEEASGLFSNHDLLAKQLMASGERTFERVWRLPIYPEYKEGLKSSIADIKNSGGRKASAGKGAIFLQQFIDSTIPWAHIDIAGTAYLSETKPYHPTVATGVGVRLLIDFIEML
ncbi:MAG: leucyl aminopeptidase [Chlamydiia bacterium]